MRFASQLAEPFASHMTSQATFASAVQLPLQLAVHFSSQLTLGGVPVHLPSQSALQVAWHLATQSAWVEAPLVLAEHSPEHEPLQSVLHCPSQVKVPGLALHAPVQLPWQLPVHEALAEAVHMPVHPAARLTLQTAEKVTGVQSAVQSTPVLKTHPASSWVVSARASPATLSPTATKATPSKHLIKLIPTLLVRIADYSP